MRRAHLQFDVREWRVRNVEGGVVNVGMQVCRKRPSPRARDRGEADEPVASVHVRGRRPG
ncbi:hypothetical protein [Alicyclobacillus sp.]|uniref:hypothetical protein n=1 Tax=Alicyclobacillus sp. TaxID=61169 RepID=UPI0025C16045|nr:hypothetical protein [Alicyclobacillus sp.]MCL6516384.1 hypothetical protein [Alicyclobacillus sp.]